MLQANSVDVFGSPLLPHLALPLLATPGFEALALETGLPTTSLCRIAQGLAERVERDAAWNRPDRKVRTELGWAQIETALERCPNDEATLCAAWFASVFSLTSPFAGVDTHWNLFLARAGAGLAPVDGMPDLVLDVAALLPVIMDRDEFVLADEDSLEMDLLARASGGEPLDVALFADNAATTFGTKALWSQQAAKHSRQSWVEIVTWAFTVMPDLPTSLNDTETMQAALCLPDPLRRFHGL